MFAPEAKLLGLTRFEAFLCPLGFAVGVGVAVGCEGGSGVAVGVAVATGMLVGTAVAVGTGVLVGDTGVAVGDAPPVRLVAKKEV